MSSYTPSPINPDLLIGRKMREHYQQTFREQVSAPTSSFAKKQLEKMGWSEGTGLGKKRDGITSHIKVKKRKVGLGLGKSEKPDIVVAHEAAGEWWKDGLGATLAKLGNKKNSKKKDKKSKKKAKKFTDEELFQATGGTRFGMRAGITNNLHKWVRTENAENPVATEEDPDPPHGDPLMKAVLQHDERVDEERHGGKSCSEETEDSSEDAEAKKKSKKRKIEAEEDSNASKEDKKKSKKEKKKKKRKLLEEQQQMEKTQDDDKEDDDKAKELRKEKKRAKKAKKEAKRLANST